MTDSLDHNEQARAAFELILPKLERLRAMIAAQIPPRFRAVISPDDILQEVCVAASRNLAMLTSIGSLDHWLKTVALTQTVSAIRKVRALKRGGEAQFVAHQRFASLTDFFALIQSKRRRPSSDIRASEAAHALAIALEQLSPERRRVIEMRYLAGLDQTAIAQQLNRSKSSINSLLFNGLKELRRILGAAEEFLSGCSPLPTRTKSAE